MPLYAFANGVTVLNADNMNQLLALQNFQLIYDGNPRQDFTGVGGVENSIASYNYCAVIFGSPTITTIGRVALELDKDGVGADVVVQLRKDMDVNTGAMGALLKQVVIPREFIPLIKGWVSVPMGLSNLATGTGYYLVIQKAGDSNNKIDIIGTPDAFTYSFRRSGASGAWQMMSNHLHAVIYDGGEEGDLRHCIYGDVGFTTLEYDAFGQVSKVYRYLPPEGGSSGGIRNVQTFTWEGECLKGGTVG